MPAVPPTPKELEQQRRFLEKRTKDLKEQYEKPAGQWTAAYEKLRSLESDLAKLPKTDANATARKALEAKIKAAKEHEASLYKTFVRVDRALNSRVKDKKAWVGYVQKVEMLKKKGYPAEIAQMICAYEYRRKFGYDDSDL